MRLFFNASKKNIVIKPGLFFMCIAWLFCLSIITCTGEIKPIKPLVKEKEIYNIKFFLETSASMEGYLRGNSDFTKTIPNLLVDIENRIPFRAKSIMINYISDSIVQYAKSTRDFIHDISTTKVATAKSSQMHKIFEEVTKATDSNDISILVSDCILSYSDADIRNNIEINVQKADGELKAFVKDAFLKMKARNVCASVYGFSSRFFGTYYNYQNGKIKFDGEYRPYYIWIIGDKQLVQRFNKQLIDIVSFKPELNINFGMFDKPIDNYSLLFKTAREGEWTYDNNHLVDVSATKKKPLKFSIAADFSALPVYARDLTYLKNNLKLEKSDLECRIIEVKKSTDIDLSKAAPNEKGPLQDATHVITFEISEIFQPKGSIGVKLPLLYDTAYKNWSIMDDRSKSSITNKTFAFEYLVDGIREAYQNNNEYYINISINIKK
jgi:hypothetical protein